MEQRVRVWVTKSDGRTLQMFRLGDNETCSEPDRVVEIPLPLWLEYIEAKSTVDTLQSSILGYLQKVKS